MPDLSLKAHIEKNAFFDDIKAMRAALETISEQYKKVDDEANKSLKNIEKNTFRTFAIEGISIVKNFAKTAIHEFISISKELEGDAKFSKVFGENLKDIEDDLHSFGISVDDNKKQLIIWKSRLGDAESVRGLANLTAALIKTGSAFSRDQFGEAGEALLDLLQRSKLGTKSIDSLTSTFGLNKEAVLKATHEVTKLQGSFASLTKTLHPTGEQMRQIVVRSLEIQNGVNGIDDITKSFGDTAQGAMNRAADAWDDFKKSIASNAGVVQIVKEVATQIENVTKDPAALHAISEAAISVGTAFKSAVPHIKDAADALTSTFKFIDAHPDIAKMLFAGVVGFGVGGIKGAGVAMGLTAGHLAAYNLASGVTSVDDKMQDKESKTAASVASMKEQEANLRAQLDAINARNEIAAAQISEITGKSGSSISQATTYAAFGSDKTVIMENTDALKSVADAMNRAITQPGEAPKHASGGIVTGIRGGFATTRPAHGEGFVSIGAGERILSARENRSLSNMLSSPTFSMGMRAPTISASVRTPVFDPTSVPLTGQSYGSDSQKIEININASGGDSQELAAMIEERVRIALSSILSRNSGSGAGSRRF